MPRKFFMLLVALLLLATVASAREGTRIIYGAVNDNGQAVAGAKVTAIGESTYTSRNVVTNEHGIYIIEKLPADEYIIRVLGPVKGVYKPGERNVLLNHNKKEVNFELKRR